jgi:hypothetical protein
MIWANVQQSLSLTRERLLCDRNRMAFLPITLKLNNLVS